MPCFRQWSANLDQSDTPENVNVTPRVKSLNSVKIFEIFNPYWVLLGPFRLRSRKNDPPTSINLPTLERRVEKIVLHAGLIRVNAAVSANGVTRFGVTMYITWEWQSTEFTVQKVSFINGVSAWGFRVAFQVETPWTLPHHCLNLHSKLPHWQLLVVTSLEVSRTKSLTVATRP